MKKPHRQSKRSEKRPGRSVAGAKRLTAARWTKMSLIANQSTRERVSLSQPSEDLLARIGNIPLLFNANNQPSHEQVKLDYDSWAHGAGVGVRDVVDGYIRRLRFKAGTITLELVAERRLNRWEFVGRAYTKDAVVHDLVLMVDRQRMLPGFGGFFHWTSEKLLRNLMLISSGKQVSFEGVPW